MRKALWKSLLRRSLVVMLAALIGMQLWYGVQIWWYREHAPLMTSFMERGLASMAQSRGKAQLQHRYVPYERISIEARRAVIAAEDSRFVEHFGFDLEGIQYALKKNLREGEPVAGGSTISQQLAKNLFLTGSRSYGRKLQEAIITLELEGLLSKRRILELYLNFAEWGEGIYGIEAAARYYYGVPASALNGWQAARLAAMLPKPRFYQQAGNTDWLVQKTGIILRRMPQVRIP